LIDLRNETLQTLCELVYQLGSDYAIFIPMVNKVLTKQNISDARYETLVARLMKNQPLQEADMEDKLPEYGGR
jgi:FKBP12-rapamycin complex-associated protein